MYTKAKIFNLALGALLLQRQISDVDTDISNENKVLLTHFDTAFLATLEDLDLDSTSTQKPLELLATDPTELWGYAYKYPNDCAFFRRLQSSVVVDNRTTHVAKRIAIHNGQKVIFTNQPEAIIEYISKDVPLGSLTATMALAVAYRLAILSAPLVSGKGSKDLMESINKRYLLIKAEAQQQDQRENFVFHDDETDSEFVEVRTS